MLIRAMDLLQNVSNVQFGFFVFRGDLMYKITDRLTVTGLVTRTMRYVLWEKSNLEAFLGFQAEENGDKFLLIVKSSFLTQEALNAIMSTIIQYPANFEKAELCTPQTTAESE